eukprot:2072041-Karenia_brevis.AAC.1
MADQNRIVPWDTQPMDSSGSQAGGDSLRSQSIPAVQGPALELGPGGSMAVSYTHLRAHETLSDL